MDSLAGFLEADVAPYERTGRLHERFRDLFPVAGEIHDLSFVSHEVKDDGHGRSLFATFQLMTWSSDRTAIEGISEQTVWLTKIPTEVERGLFVIEGARFAIPSERIESWLEDVASTAASLAARRSPITTIDESATVRTTRSRRATSCKGPITMGYDLRRRDKVGPSPSFEDDRYFRLNVQTMSGLLRPLLATIGAAAPPYVGCGATAETRVAVAPDGVPPFHKLCTNEGWWISPAECRVLSSKLVALLDATLSRIEPTAEEAAMFDLLRRFATFCETCAAHDGFEVH